MSGPKPNWSKQAKIKASSSKVDTSWQINTQINRINFAGTHNMTKDYIAGIKVFETNLSPQLRKSYPNYYNIRNKMFELISYLEILGASEEEIKKLILEANDLLYNLLHESLAQEGKTYIGDEVEVVG